MPSFAFWKSSKTDEAKAPLPTEGTVEETSVLLPVTARNLDLNPGEKNSGVFLFDEEDTPQPSPQQSSTPESDPDQHTPTITSSIPLRKLSAKPQRSMGEADGKTETVQQAQEDVEQMRPVSPSKQTHTIDTVSIRSISPAPDSFAGESHEGDSGVYLADDESLPPQSRPASLAISDSASRSRASSLSLKHTAALNCSTPPQRTETTSHRLKRPAELNLGANAAVDASKPRSELEKRYDLIRNSKTRSKAALRSPTELLNERLNMAPKKDKKEDIRVFTPPKPIVNGCWLPGPGAQMDAFTSTSVRARTEAGGRPAWWCKTDKLVVFDSVDVQADGNLTINTRTSKGLSIARRRGDTETIVIPMDCAHCQAMLNRHEWKYDMQVCKRSVCWDCKERCKWELEEEKRANETSGDETATKSDGNRYRADSVLQDEQNQEDDMMQKVGIEKDRPMSPIETMGGIEERLESREAGH